MDPDAEAEQAASQFLKNSFITVVFTTCHYYETQTTASVIQFSPATATNKQLSAASIKKKARTIYISFDDGPNKGTRNTLNIINEEEIPVTFFLVGEHVYGSRMQQEIFDSLLRSKYVELANHSFTHAFHNKFSRFYKIPDSAIKDFIRCADSLHLVSGIIRTPGRNVWRLNGISSTDIKSSTATADSLWQNNFSVVGWDLEWHFDNALKLTNSSDDLIRQLDSVFINLKTKTPGHLVLLAHDQVYEDSADSTELHQLIKKLKASDEYNFETVGKYPGIKN